MAVRLARCGQPPGGGGNWWQAADTSPREPADGGGLALLVFPKLALGLSGFETGVAVMPQIRGAADDTDANPAGRIRGARRML